MALVPMATLGPLDEADILDLGGALRKKEVNVKGYVALTAGGEDLRVPAVVIAGTHPGPTAWVIAGVDGYDYLGASALARILPAVEPSMISGRVIITPLFNASASGGGAQRGRGYGAEPEGWTNAKSGPIAPLRDVAQEILETCDMVVELGSGGEDLLRGAFTAYPRVGGAVEEASAAMARAAGFPLLWAAEGGDVPGSLMAMTTRRGKGCILIELGGAGRLEEAWVVNMALALQGALARTGVLWGQTRSLPGYRIFRALAKVEAHRPGLWRRAVEPEVAVAPGSPLGRVFDAFGQEVQVVGSPAEATVLGIRTRGSASPGLCVAELGHDLEGENSPWGGHDVRP